MKMDIKERITRAKVKLQREKPFFAYLILNLNIQEGNKETQTASIDSNGNLYYNPKWINTLNDEQLKTLFSHEVLHLALLHLIRRGNRDRGGFNIATDLVINTILEDNGFERIEGGVYCDTYECGDIKGKDTFTIGKKKIKEVRGKSAETIYDELPRKAKNSKGFDVHIYSEGTGKDKEEQERESTAQANKWKRLITEAHTYSKNIGKEASGIDRQIGDLLDEKVNWKTLLHRYITKTIPYDYTYNFPSKKSLSCGFYMPSVKKEEVDISAVIDTSGSIDNEQIQEFITEIISIAKSFNNVKIRLIPCDCQIQGDYPIENGNIATIQELKFKGGGGTDFNIPLNYIRDNYNQTKLVIYFTDGFGTKIQQGDYPFNLIWLIAKGNDDLVKDSGEVIRI